MTGLRVNPWPVGGVGVPVGIPVGDVKQEDDVVTDVGIQMLRH